MNIIKKFLIVCLLISMFMVIEYTNKFEVSALSEISGQAKDFINAGSTAGNGINISAITDNFVGLGQILTTIGAGVLVAVTAYMGIKYMISPPDKQAALKQQLIGVVFSGIVIFGSYGIWKAVITVVKNF